MICITANTRFPSSIVICFVFHIEVRAVTKKNVCSALLFEGKQQVSPFFHDLGLGFGWLNWEIFACRPTTPSGCRATSEPKSFIQSCCREIFGRRPKWRIYFSRIWILQFPSVQLSGYNKLGAFREEWKRSIASDRTPTFSSEQDYVDPIYHSLMFLPCVIAGIVHDVVHSSQSCQDLCSLSIRSIGRILSLWLLKFCLPGINPELMNVNWLHIRHDKLYLKKPSGIMTLSCNEG